MLKYAENTKAKNLRDRCEEMDDKLSFSDKKLKEEIEENEAFINHGEKLKTELEILLD